MQFVNEIAEIIHAIVDEHHGFANTNSGEGFLLVWKFNDAAISRQRTAPYHFIN